MEVKPFGTISHFVPQEWLDLLAHIKQTTGYDAYIAGGALRDLVHGAQIKDVDIFVVPEGPVGDGMWFGPYAAVLGFKHVVNLMYTEDEHDIASVYGLLEHHRGRYGSWDYQIITMRQSFDLLGVVNRIDFGICQIGVDAHGTVYLSDQFRSDSAMRVFTLTRPDDPRSRVRAEDRYQRLLQKYPGWDYQTL